MNAVTSMLTTLERGIAEAAKQAMQEVPLHQSVYVGEFLHDPSYNTNQVITARGNRYYTKPNRTKTLRPLYGNIHRAVTPMDVGNVAHVELKSGIISATFGFDTSASVQAGTRKINLEYAAIQEKKRPFLSKGFAKFYKDPQGFKAILDDLQEAILELAK